MTGKTLDIRHVVEEDQIGVWIAKKWMEWNMLRQPAIAEWEEIRKYVYATDTTTTTNKTLPWRNRTTIPKLCQIRDNLIANYIATVFPKRKWLRYEASNEQSAQKIPAITQYMSWAISQPQFKQELYKMIADYIDNGNTFATVEWLDERVESEDGKEQVGYVGPIPVRWSPIDLVFNPTAPTFVQSPKIYRSLLTLGEIKEFLQRLSPDDNQNEYEDIYKYIMNLRMELRQWSGADIQTKDEYYNVDGFGSFRQYMDSDFVELLTFYGDFYDRDKDKFYKNHQIMVIDRHKVISIKPNPSIFGHAPIFHAGWRKRQDNLWAQGPLANLVGMQYRLDHLENAKADALDLIIVPPLEIKGTVEDFEWGPWAKIYVGDEGEVNPKQVPFQVLQIAQELNFYMQSMEEMAGAPKEAMGFRSPGEKTKYEVQRLENASARIFQNKTSQFEEEVIEPLLNAMLEMARRKLTGAITIPVFNDEFSFTTFSQLSAQDITGVGTLRPIAARHYAEKADTVQNLTQFFGSPIGQDPAVKVHFSGIGLAKTFEDLLDITDYKLVQPNIRMDEEAQSQRLAQQHQVNNQMQLQTPSGMTPDDAGQPYGGAIPQQGAPQR